MDGALRYFVGQVFLMNWDSYLGHTGHNYFLYEEEGQLSILPWGLQPGLWHLRPGHERAHPGSQRPDQLSHPHPPPPGRHMKNRPLYHNLMQVEEYFQQYQAYFLWFLEEYVESGRLSAVLWEAAGQIAPYVQKDPTAFCSYEDHRLAVETLEQGPAFSGERPPEASWRAANPATLAQQLQRPGEGVDASHLDLGALGDFEDLYASAGN